MGVPHRLHGPGSALRDLQARFNRYLEHRGIKDTSRSRVWAFLGDGEMDERSRPPPSRSPPRERLDNLTFVVNCNLQRLDGPVRPNFKIVQELEAQFPRAGWHVVKVPLGLGWDPVLARDNRRRAGCAGCARCPTPSSRRTPPATRYVRDHFFGAEPRPARPRRRSRRRRAAGAVRTSRAGHEPRKVHARLPGRRRAPGRADRRPGADVKGHTLAPASSPATPTTR
ncbi:hypothetical protein GCM10020221_25080 [Streptomyces thioluteus]|uniref:Uncharacterized protein n=1 Tax=Streptomyces thioluteus TaxID=66431 RepID=A0ABP6JDE9_STRTU